MFSGLVLSSRTAVQIRLDSLSGGRDNWETAVWGSEVLSVSVRIFNSAPPRSLTELFAEFSFAATIRGPLASVGARACRSVVTFKLSIVRRGTCYETFVRRSWRNLLAGLSLLAVVPMVTISTLHAQNTSSVHGVISDAQGAVVPGAVVALSSATTGASRQVVTDNTGAYQILQDNAGRVHIDCHQAGLRESNDRSTWCCRSTLPRPSMCSWKWGARVKRSTSRLKLRWSAPPTPRSAMLSRSTRSGSCRSTRAT